MIKTRRKVLAGKIEAVEGVAEALLAADGGIIALDVKWTPDIKMLQRNAALPSLSKMKQIPGLSLAHVSFKAELMGCAAAFAAGVLPPVDPYLRCCGFAATLVVTPGVETVTYKPASTGVPSMTIGVYTDGILKKLTGARGAVKFSTEVGGQIFAEFDFMGAYNAVTDVAILAPTFPTLIPPRSTGATFTIGGYTPVLRSLSIDMGNTLAPRKWSWLPPMTGTASGKQAHPARSTWGRSARTSTTRSRSPHPPWFPPRSAKATAKAWRSPTPPSSSPSVPAMMKW